MQTVIGAFDNAAQAEKAAQDLVSAGIARDDISLVANNEGGRYAPITETTTEGTTVTGHAVGHDAKVGAEWGAGIGFLVGLTGLAIPGLGWIAGAGWLMGTLLGAGTGAVIGGLVGALTHVGVPEEDAQRYTAAVQHGSVLLAIRASDEQAHRVADILDKDGAINIDERVEQYQQKGFLPAPSTPMTTPAIPAKAAMPASPTPPVTSPLKAGGEQVLPVVEETIAVGKREVQRGGVRVFSHVTERPVQESVSLREEHVTVERRPVDRPAGANAFNAVREGVVEITETAEVPIVSKEARIIEEVVVGKQATERVETVRDTARRTDVEVEPIAGSEHVSRTAVTFATYATDFRNHWQNNYANAGGRYEDYEPSYRYGYDLANNPQYRGQNWNAVESAIQNDWNRRSPNTWDRMKNSIRYGFDRGTSGSVPGEGNIPGIQTGGHALDGTPDTRGITEKIADTVTGNRIDDKTGKSV